MDCCDHKKNTHKNHGGHLPAQAGGMSHGSAGSYLRRFWIVTLLLVPLVLTNEPVAHFLNIPVLALGKWLQFGIATVIFGFALVFFQHAWHEIKARAFGMMTLVSMAVAAGYAFSVVATFVPSLGVQFYLEISTLVWVLLFGHYLEARSSAAAGDALSETAKLLPKQAHKIVDGVESDVDIVELAEGDTVLVKPGEKVPADGTVKEGAASVDESHISGESKPVEKKAGSTVVAGSISLDSSLTVVLTRVGEHSSVGQIQKLIAQAQGTKPRQARIADRAAAVLTFAAGGIALLTFAVWTLAFGAPFVFALTLAITVLVIACPHALGLAIPTVTTITTSLAAKNGVFIKDLAKIETIKKANYVVFDKTGTLTEGAFGVREVFPLADSSAEEVLAAAAAIERHSSHVVGRAVAAYAAEHGAERREAAEVKNIPGKGMTALVGGKAYAAGNRALMRERGVGLGEAEKKAEAYAARGETVIYVAQGTQAIGLIALADRVKPESHQAVEKLHRLGVKVAMLTGDTAQVAAGVAEELGIDTYFAEVLPEDKYRYVKELQGKGRVVLMVGDGVNDAPALTQADVGVAVGAGTDVALEAGDVVLTRNNPLDIVRLVTLSRAVYSKMVQNLLWALGYNVVAIPMAAGVFAAWGFYLRPEVGALVMSLSTVIVVINALSLKRINLDAA